MRRSTPTNALFVTALVLLGAVTGTVGISQPAAAAPDSPTYRTADGVTDLVFAGEAVTVTGLSADSQYQLRRIESVGPGGNVTESVFVDVLTANGTGEIGEIETAGLDPGDYYVSGNGVLETVDNSFEVVEQEVDFELLAGRLGDEDDTAGALSVTSNRRQFDVLVTSDQFDSDDSELRGIFSDAASADDSDLSIAADTDELRLNDVSDDTTYRLNFSELDPGRYNFTFEVVDTGATSRTTTVVGEAEPGEAALTSSTTRATRGGIATVTISLEGNARGGTATVVIGEVTEDNYQANISIEDGDGDGRVTLGFNTYRAGNSSLGSVVELAGDSASGSDDLAFDADGDQKTLTGMLDTGGYTVSVGTEDEPVDVLENPDNVGLLVIEERAPVEQTMWRSSRKTREEVTRRIAEDDIEASSAILDAIEDGELTQTDSIALDADGDHDDVLVHQVTAPGLAGLLGASGDVTEQFFDALETTNGFGDPAVNLVLEQRDPGNNRDAARLDLANAVSAGDIDSNSVSVVSAGRGTYYVFIDYGMIDADTFESSDDTFGDGDTVTATVAVQSPRLLDVDTSERTAEEIESVYQTSRVEFDLRAADAEFDVAADETVVVEPLPERSVTGTTNVAPGTEFTVRLVSTGDARTPLRMARLVTVEPDGTFEAQFDLSDASIGDTFEVTIRGAGFTATADGEVVDTTTTLTPTVTPAGTTETRETTTDESTSTPPPTPTDVASATVTERPERTTATTPGFGAVLAVIALIGAALLAVRRDN